LGGRDQGFIYYKNERIGKYYPRISEKIFPKKGGKIRQTPEK
jgi:hypothetical protein